MFFSLIAAVDSKNGIGKGGTLPWHIPTDLKFFNETTRGAGKNAVIMGRTTYESLPEKFRPLPGRLNIILTHDKDYAAPDGVMVAESFPYALSMAENAEVEELFVIGGAKVFDFAIHNPSCKKIYLTKIDGDFSCDSFFPAIPSAFHVANRAAFQEENGVRFAFWRYEKK